MVDYVLYRNALKDYSKQDIEFRGYNDSYGSLLPLFFLTKDYDFPMHRGPSVLSSYEIIII